jgi:hypothetical protein
MPRLISSTLANAMSKILAGSDTTGKPMKATVYPASINT